MLVLAADPVLWLLRRPPVTTPAWGALRDAAEALVAHDVAALLVLSPEAPLAIVTERDVVRALASGADPDEVRIGDVMTAPLLTVEADTSVEDAMTRMLDGGVRHLVVLDGDGPRGVLSIRDLAAVLLAPHGGALPTA